MNDTHSGLRGQSNKPAAAEIESFKRLVMRYRPLRPIFLFEFAELLEHRSGRSVSGESWLKLRTSRLRVDGLDPAFVEALRGLVRDQLIELRLEAGAFSGTAIVSSTYHGPRRGPHWERLLQRRSQMIQRTLAGAWKR